MTAELAFSGSYDYRLLALPASVSAVAAYVALDLAERAKAASGKMRLLSLAAAALAMATGIWASRYNSGGDMHPLSQVLYDWPTILLSFLAAAGGSGAALWLASRPQPRLPAVLSAGVLMGAAIASRFYIGMAALRLQTVQS